MKKQPKKPEKRKLVRIDERTQIEVLASIPDAVAVAKYIAKNELWANAQGSRTRGLKKKNDQLQLDKEDFDSELRS